MKTAYYTDTAIFGIGNDSESAKKDAFEWTDSHLSDDERWDEVNRMSVAYITDELAERVESEGGDILFYENDGVLQSSIPE